jgi:hypothetical protein
MATHLARRTSERLSLNRSAATARLVKGLGETAPHSLPAISCNPAGSHAGSPYQAGKRLFRRNRPRQRSTRFNAPLLSGQSRRKYNGDIDHCRAPHVASSGGVAPRFGQAAHEVLPRLARYNVRLSRSASHQVKGQQTISLIALSREFSRIASPKR